MSKRLIHQTEALYWLLGRCEDQFVRSWISMEMQTMIRGGGTPDNEELAKYKIEEVTPPKATK